MGATLNLVKMVLHVVDRMKTFKLSQQVSIQIEKKKFTVVSILFHHLISGT